MKKSLHFFLAWMACMILGIQTSAAQQPVFSSEDGSVEQFYQVTLLKNGQCMGVASDASVRLQPKSNSNAQFWKLVGTAENFQLVNKDGSYAIISNQSVSNPSAGATNPKPLRVSANPQDMGFTLIESSNTKYGAGYEIKVNSEWGNENILNTWGDVGKNNSFGLWKLGDDNNVFAFMELGDLPREEVPSTGKAGYKPDNALTLWYDEPATTAPLYTPDQWYTRWVEYSLPLGDGQFGASLFGGIVQDQILFNEKTLWSGTSQGWARQYGKYEVFGSVYADMLDDDLSATQGAKDYYRQLDLTTATGKVSFADQNGVTYTREYIASYPAHAVVARYTASENGKVSLRIKLESGKPSINVSTTYEEDEAYFAGSLETVSYNARIKVVPTNGTMKTTSKGIEVRGADQVLVILAGGTDYDIKSPTFVSGTAELAGKIQQRVRAAADQTWEKLYKAHLDDYQGYFGRVDFDLEGTANEMPTNELIDSYNQGYGAQALMLERLYFAYGRYLEIASSRGVSVPSNLQGIWNDNPAPAWNADIHSNINVQMNYWPAEPTNLSDMHLPLLYFIYEMAENHDQWKNYARESNQNRGWTIFTESNIFGGVGDFAHNYVIANAWLATHLWQHYRYTLDRKYLQEVFPAMLSASQFWMDRLKLDSDGLYVCPDEYSPEHGPKQEDGVAHAQQLVYELFSNTLDAIKVLGTDANVSEKDLAMLKERFDKLDRGLRTEIYDGSWWSSELQSGDPILREWKYSNYNNWQAEREHRHMSHLMCLYPYSQIYPGTELFKAAVNSMKLRGDGATGWSMGWKINLWARALDGDHARTILNNALRHANNSSGVYYNLFDAHNPFQIDGNFGACAGIAEMIMQSNSDTIRVLPALPTAWNSGHMTGLKAVKDFTVNVYWKDGKATRVEIVNNKGQEIPVLYAGLKDAVALVNGKYDATVKADDRGIIVLGGEAGTKYEFLMGDAATGITDAAVEALQVKVQNGKLTVSGKDVKSVKVFDLQGRLIQTSSNAELVLNAQAGTVCVVEVLTVDGEKLTQKVIVE